MQLQSEFTINHVNIRREKCGEEQGPVAVDIKIGAKLSPDELHGLFATESSFQRILGELWNSDNELTTGDVDKITLKREGVGVSVAFIPPVSGDKVLLDGASVNKIVLRPEAGRIVDLSMRVQGRPTKEQIARFSEWLNCDLQVAISQRQGELPLSSSPTAEKEDDEAPHAGLLDGGIDKALGADQAHVQKSVEDLAAAGVLKVNAPAAEAPAVPGQKPPQRPKKSAAEKTTH